MGLLFRLFLILGTLHASVGIAGELAIIVNSELGVASLTKEEVANLFLKKKANWPTGEAVESVTYAEENPLRQAFNKLVLNMSSQEEDRHWVQQGYSGGVKPPAKVPAEAMALALTGLKKGSLAYVNAASVTDAKVKIVFKISY